jgi:hypothetical protein
VGQEGVTETGTGRGAGCQTGNVDAGEEGGHLGGGLVDLAQPVESRVRNRDTSLLGVAGRIKSATEMRRLDFKPTHMVAYGKLAALPRSVCERVLKKLDLPTFGNPTIPICRDCQRLSKLVCHRHIFSQPPSTSSHRGRDRPDQHPNPTHLQVVSRSPQERLLGLFLLLLRRHLLL